MHKAQTNQLLHEYKHDWGHETHQHGTTNEGLTEGLVVSQFIRTIASSCLLALKIAIACDTGYDHLLFGTHQSHWTTHLRPQENVSLGSLQRTHPSHDTENVRDVQELQVSSLVLNAWMWPHCCRSTSDCRYWQGISSWRWLLWWWWCALDYCAVCLHGMGIEG
jgi:hypothetical protein